MFGLFSALRQAAKNAVIGGVQDAVEELAADKAITVTIKPLVIPAIADTPASELVATAEETQGKKKPKA